MWDDVRFAEPWALIPENPEPLDRGVQFHYINDDSTTGILDLDTTRKYLKRQEYAREQVIKDVSRPYFDEQDTAPRNVEPIEIDDHSSSHGNATSRSAQTKSSREARDLSPNRTSSIPQPVSATQNLHADDFFTPVQSCTTAYTVFRELTDPVVLLQIYCGQLMKSADCRKEYAKRSNDSLQLDSDFEAILDFIAAPNSVKECIKATNTQHLLAMQGRQSILPDSEPVHTRLEYINAYRDAVRARCIWFSTIFRKTKVLPLIELHQHTQTLEALASKHCEVLYRSLPTRTDLAVELAHWRTWIDHFILENVTGNICKDLNCAYHTLLEVPLVTPSIFLEHLESHVDQIWRNDYSSSRLASCDVVM